MGKENKENIDNNGVLITLTYGEKEIMNKVHISTENGSITIRLDSGKIDLISVEPIIGNEMSINVKSPSPITKRISDYD